MNAVLEAYEPSARHLSTPPLPTLLHFETVACAPGGLTRLRELILMLAVQGKLAHQQKEDLPASDLLQSIRDERECLIKAKQVRRTSAPTRIDEDEKPFRVPAGWAWARLDELSPLGLSDGDWIETKDQDPGGEVRLVQLADIGDGFFKDKSARFITAEKCAELNCTLLQPADVLLARLPSPIGRACVFPGLGRPAITAVDVAICRLGEGVLPAYLTLAVNAPFTRLTIESYGKGATRFRVSTGHLKTLPIPVPPTAEQARIVDRVDELMRLCDALEAKGKLEAAQHAQLLDALLGALTGSSSPEELAKNWRRVAMHFDLLLDRPEAVDALEQTILQLAVRGLLVQQDSNEEPASALLERIRIENQRLITSAKTKGERARTQLARGEEPFGLPPQWKWTRFNELIEADKPISYGVLVPGPEVTGGVPFVRIADLSLTDPPSKPEKSISAEVDAQYLRTRLAGGEILMGVVGSIGKLGVAPPSWAGANIARAICRIVPTRLMSKSFVLLLLESKFMQSTFAGETRTLAQPTLNVGLIRNAPTPVPPLAEQDRIVARVKQVRQLCADLRQRLGARQATQDQLAEVLVKQAGT